LSRDSIRPSLASTAFALENPTRAQLHPCIPAGRHVLSHPRDGGLGISITVTATKRKTWKEKTTKMPVTDENSIDAIALEKVAGRVSLYMFESREWNDLAVMLKQLEAKVNAYVIFVKGGQIDESPQYRGLSRRIVLDCQYMPPESVLRQLDGVRTQLRRADIEFAACVEHWNPIHF
jgi:hypothetical protein